MTQLLKMKIVWLVRMYWRFYGTMKWVQQNGKGYRDCTHPIPTSHDFVQGDETANTLNIKFKEYNSIVMACMHIYSIVIF